MGLNAFHKGLLDRIPSQDFKFPQLYYYVNIHTQDFEILHNGMYNEIHFNGFNHSPLIVCFYTILSWDF